MRLSARLGWNAPENALTALSRRAAARGPILDLTDSNPTRVGLVYPEEALRAALARTDAATYTPAPLGLPTARAAVAADYARAGVTLDPARVVLTASSSEAYSHLFKLTCDPGDAVLVPEPSYPLFDALARLDGVVPVPYRLSWDGVWHVDFASVDAAITGAPRARAIVVVNPNNPTGSFVKRDEAARLARTCADAGLAVIADEVFAPYAAAPDPARVTTAAADPALAGVPTFSLGGLSKACGLPQLKLGWIVVGPHGANDALAALESIADTYLSVAGPVQAALADVLALGAGVRAAIAARVNDNRARLAAALPPHARTTLLPSEAGWSALLRVPATRSDEAWAAALVTEAGVLVHPGYFFDLQAGTFLVVSLLPRPDVFAAGISRALAFIEGAGR